MLQYANDKAIQAGTEIPQAYKLQTESSQTRENLILIQSICSKKITQL